MMTASAKHHRIAEHFDGEMTHVETTQNEICSSYVIKLIFFFFCFKLASLEGVAALLNQRFSSNGEKPQYHDGLLHQRVAMLAHVL